MIAAWRTDGTGARGYSSNSGIEARLTTEQAGRDRQIEVLGGEGLGQPTALPISYEQWEELAHDTLPAPVFDYIVGAAGAEETLQANREAFARYKLLPHMLRNVEQRTLGVNVLGTPCP